MNEEILTGVDSPRLIRECIRLASLDPERNLLLLADLYPPHSRLSEIHTLTRKGRVIDFSTIYRGFANPSVVLGTRPKTKIQLLQHMLPKIKSNFMCICDPQELALFKGKAEILDSHNEVQMILGQLARPAGKRSEAEIESVEQSEIGELDHFYSANGAAAWLPIQFESGPYYCAKIGGRIVSAAGVHFSTPKIAQLGNIMTAKAYRRNGFASLCTYALASELNSTNRIVSLFVVEENDGAIRIYERIGFHKKRKVVFASLKATGA